MAAHGYFVIANRDFLVRTPLACYGGSGDDGVRRSQSAVFVLLGTFGAGVQCRPIITMACEMGLFRTGVVFGCRCCLNRFQCSSCHGG